VEGEARHEEREALLEDPELVWSGMSPMGRSSEQWLLIGRRGARSLSRGALSASRGAWSWGNCGSERVAMWP
jgi:hypothetical protein